MQALALAALIALSVTHAAPAPQHPSSVVFASTVPGLRLTGVLYRPSFAPAPAPLSHPLAASRVASTRALRMSSTRRAQGAKDDMTPSPSVNCIPGDYRHGRSITARRFATTG